MASLRHGLLGCVVWLALGAAACSQAHSVDPLPDAIAEHVSDGQPAPEPGAREVAPELLPADAAAVTPPDAAATGTDSGRPVGPRLPPDSGCLDTDAANDFLKPGYVIYTDENGEYVLLYDTCKVEGPNGMLKEVTCNGYHGPDTKPADLQEIYITCDCELGACQGKRCDVHRLRSRAVLPGRERLDQ